MVIQLIFYFFSTKLFHSVKDGQADNPETCPSSQTLLEMLWLLRSSCSLFFYFQLLIAFLSAEGLYFVYVFRESFITIKILEQEGSDNN